jgi:sporulation protein YtfJ
MIDSLVKTILGEMKQVIQNETVIGEPIKAGGVTLLPVSRISIGFGAGGGKSGSKNREAEGTGGGISIEPVAFLVVHENKVDLLPVKMNESEIAQVIKLIPIVAEKIRDLIGKKDEKPKATGKKPK